MNTSHNFWPNQRAYNVGYTKCIGDTSIQMVVNRPKTVSCYSRCGYIHFVTIPSTHTILPRRCEVSDLGVTCLDPKLKHNKIKYFRTTITL
jgi:hypothetical protein